MDDATMKHIETLAARAAEKLLVEAQKLDEEARIASCRAQLRRQEAEEAVAFERQRLINLATGTQSLWRVTLRGGKITDGGMGGYACSGVVRVLASSKEEAEVKARDPALRGEISGEVPTYIQEVKVEI